MTRFVLFYFIDRALFNFPLNYDLHGEIEKFH